VLCAAFGLGNAVELAKFYVYGRGHYQQAVRTIAGSDSKRVTGSLDGVVNTMLEFYGERLKLPIEYVSNKEFCGSNAAWFIETEERPIAQAETISFGGPACATRFQKVAEYPAWGLSGWSWTLYRADNQR
jgi:hypothetical protein